MSCGGAYVGLNRVPEVQLGVVQDEVLILKVPRYMRKPRDQFPPIEWRLGLHNWETTSRADDLKTSIREAFGLANEETGNNFCSGVVDHDYYVSLLRSYGLDHPCTPFNEVEVKSSLVLDALVLILCLDRPPRDDLGGHPGYIRINSALRTILDKPLVRLRFTAMQLDIFLVENQMPLALLKKAVNKLIYLPMITGAPLDGPSMEIAILHRVLLTAINLAWPFTGGSEHKQFAEYFRYTYPKETLADTLDNCPHILDCVYRVLQLG